MEEYKKYTDEELLEQLNNGNTQIIDFIMEKYKDLVRRKARALYLMGGDSDDLIQEGMIGLFKAVRDYQNNKETSFYTFAELCITRQLYSAIQASNRKKHTPLNSYVSLYSGMVSQHEQTIPLKDILPSVKEGNPEDLVIDRESARQMEKALRDRLSQYEIQVLNYYMQGDDYLQISERLDKTPKSVDNALQRIRNKMSKL